MLLGYQPPKFQQFDGKGNPKQHIAHFVKTCENAGSRGDQLVRHTKRTVSMMELTNMKQRKGKPVIDYINRWRTLSLDCKDRLTELSTVEMCTQDMHWGLLYILQGIKPHLKKGDEGAEQIVKSTVKESMVVNTTPLKFSKRKEGRVEKKDDGRERRRPTLKERQKKVYPFPGLDIADMLEQLLEKQLIQLPKCKRSEQVGKELILRLAREKKIELDFEEEVAPEDSQEKERSIEEDDEGWIVVTHQKKRKSTPTQKESHFYINYRRGNKTRKNKKKKTRKPKLVHEEDKDFPRPQRLVTLADFFRTRFLCDHQDENLEVVACHAINAVEEESIPSRSLEEDGLEDLSRFNVDDLLSLPQETKTILINALLNSAASSSSAPTATYESTPYCMSIDFSDQDLLLGSKLHNRSFYVSGYVREQRVDWILINNGSTVNIMPKSTMRQLGILMDELSNNAKFYLKKDNSPEAVPAEIPLVNREDNVQLKSVASREPHKSTRTFNSRKGEASTSTTKSMILMDEKTSNPSILRYVPLLRRKKGESPFVESSEGLKVGDIKVLKESFTTLLTKITKQEIKIDRRKKACLKGGRKTGSTPRLTN
ncbi:retrotransposon gag protein [Cucumis melo var. makuwa]|uniref:Retrotransposon gag protein n=1 Tax=Cucumis melo var. makuwa TaxID=1194695 RepID=A0A5D3BGX4_CUCMM|nr:retrotransposon gag protein [Cucumis melo var. makuwa]TYJ98289.1 retrotransposon gag protein [Cucumis melo var. makuwa]